MIVDHEHTHTDHNPGEPGEVAARDYSPKNRAARRAGGQRGAGLVGEVRTKWKAPRFPAITGAERARRAAAAKGLRVRRPVRASIGWGGVVLAAPDGGDALHYPRPTSQRPLVPLERVDRYARYLLQRDVTTHVRHGINWRPSPRQRRRLDKKARHAAAFKRPEPGPVTAERAGWCEVSGPSFTPAQRANAAADAMVEQAKPRGFRIVDRRGEHR